MPTAILQLDPKIEVDTPRGRAWAFAWVDYGMDTDVLWGCALRDTGKPWWYRNKYITIVGCETWGTWHPEAPASPVEPVQPSAPGGAATLAPGPLGTTGASSGDCAVAVKDEDIPALAYRTVLRGRARRWREYSGLKIDVWVTSRGTRMELFCVPDNYPSVETDDGRILAHGWYCWSLDERDLPTSYPIGPYTTISDAKSDCADVDAPVEET